MNDSAIQDTTATRTEVIDTIGPAFEYEPLSRGDLIGAAEHIGASRAVVQVLERLPERVYRRPADLWNELPDVPIGA